MIQNRIQNQIERTLLGNTEIHIPRLFLGTGSWDFKGGCAQATVPSEQYAQILKSAYEMGVNFWDTSDDYHTHAHVRLGMQGIPRDQLVIATKTYASTQSEAERILEKSLHELNTDYVDLFHLHSVDSIEGYEKRMQDALLAFKKAKQLGKIKAIGLSTHNIHVLDVAVDCAELDVIMTNFNKFEAHMDASLEWYTRCLERAYQNGKGVLVMKTLGEGSLAAQADESIQYNLSRPFIHGVCVGIVTQAELEQAIAAASSSVGAPGTTLRS